jgi:hypothetical protein
MAELFPLFPPWSALADGLTGLTITAGASKRPQFSFGKR